MAEKTILVVEDNDINRELMRVVLQRGEYRVLEAADAETGLDLARQERPDLILMDIQLPGMDGLSAAKILKSDPRMQHMPIFALTGFALESDRQKAADIGMEGYIVKPVSVKGLLDTLADWFRTHGPDQ